MTRFYPTSITVKFGTRNNGKRSSCVCEKNPTTQLWWMILFQKPVNKTVFQWHVGVRINTPGVICQDNFSSVDEILGCYD